MGAVLLREIDNKQTITMLWNNSVVKLEIKTFEQFTLSLDFLFMLGIIKYHEGIIMKIKQ